MCSFEMGGLLLRTQLPGGALWKENARLIFCTRGEGTDGREHSEGLLHSPAACTARFMNDGVPTSEVSTLWMKALSAQKTPC